MGEYTVFPWVVKQTELVTKGGRKLVGQGNRKKRTFQEAIQTLADSFSRHIKDHNKAEES